MPLLADYTGSKLSEDPLSAAPSDYTGSKLGETVGLNTFASDTASLDSEGSNLESIPCLGKSFTNDAPVVPPADAQASESLYQLAEIIGANKTQVLWDFGPSLWMLLLVMLVLPPQVCWPH